MQYDTVKSLLEKEGFTVTYRKDTNTNKADGTIIGQDFEEDVYYERGMNLNFIVARPAVVSSAPVQSQPATTSSTVTITQPVRPSNIVITENIPNNLANNHDRPIFKYSQVSSTLVAGGVVYGKDNVLFDNGLCWSEEADGVGIGEYFEFYTPTQQTVSQCIIVNGYSGSQQEFRDNGRLTIITFSFSDGTVLNYNIDPNTMGQQTFYFPREIRTTYLRVTITDAIAGDKYNDTGISFVCPG